MKNFNSIIAFSLLSFALLLSGPAYAQSTTKPKQKVTLQCIYESEEPIYQSNLLESESYYILADYAPTCEEKEKWEFYLEGTAYIMDVTALGLACTGIGTTATIWIQGAGLVVHAAQLYVQDLPCVNSKEAEQKKMIKAAVCEELEKNNIKCEPNDLPLKSEREI